ncbi:MAG: AAA family ATPase, partial [Eubacteriaceae bacterium]|nr:AAA family ATPase [Eubacteriaceae bacterium]
MENQKSFFEEISAKNTARPLASRLRPKNIEDVVGQDHLLGEGKPLRRMIETDNLSSMILYGPPGSGKTTLAYVISQSTNCAFITINATSAGIKDIRQAVDDAIKNNNLYGRKTILFIDEIHRFNTSQQDALLPYVEDGVVIIIGATTENPYFEVNSPLISRLTVFTLKELDNDDIKKILKKAINDKINGFGNYNIALNYDAEDYIVSVSSGDARFALNTLELCALTAQKDAEGKMTIDLALAKQSAQ